MIRTLNQKGMSLVELLIVVLLIAVVMGGGYLILGTGQSTWFTTDIQIQLQESLRQTLEKVTMELRQTEVAELQLFDGAGANGTDVIRFSVPVVCKAGESLIDGNADVAYRRAPLTWGCTDSTCMDADDDCATIDYQFLEYRINATGQLVRRVLDNATVLVREDIFSQNMTDFQAVLNGSVVTLQVAAEKVSAANRTLTGQAAVDVFLRN